jgi:hypothetical protein
MKKKIEATAQPVEPEIKSRKRKVEEVEEDEDVGLNEVIEKPRGKKKLKVLTQVEPKQYAHQNRRVEEPQQIDAAINLNKKLKKIIPDDPYRAASKHIKQKKGRKIIAEPKASLPRPVFTTAGIFIEEPVTPYKFKSKEYKPIKSSMGRERVALFQAANNKKKSAAAPVADFKTELLKKNKNRDKSVKNLKNLM